MAGLLTPPPLPPPPPEADGEGVAAALAAVNDARALAIIAASALALCVAFGAEALPVPTASGAVELDEDWQEATPPSAKLGCVTVHSPPIVIFKREEWFLIFCCCLFFFLFFWWLLLFWFGSELEKKRHAKDVGRENKTKKYHKFSRIIARCVSRGPTHLPMTSAHINK
jgi:hypothetical protein